MGFGLAQTRTPGKAYKSRYDNITPGVSSDAYDEGIDAFSRGDWSYTNPFDDRDQQHEDWKNGWDAAEDNYHRVD